MRREKNIIIMTLFRLGYLVYSLGNCAMIVPTETGLRCIVPNTSSLVQDKTNEEMILFS